MGNVKGRLKKYSTDEPKKTLVPVKKKLMFTQLGDINFVIEGVEASISEVGYVLATEQCDIHELVSDVAGIWGLRTPRLVLTVISSVDDFKPWKRPEIIEDFQDGIMKAASLTQLWILTDGRNSGVSFMIGKAVAQEKSRRETLEKEQRYFRFRIEEKLPSLKVMGIVPTSKLPPVLKKRLEDGVTSNKPVTLQVSSSEMESDVRTQLNPGMTHLFLYNDHDSTTEEDLFLDHPFPVLDNKPVIEDLSTTNTPLIGLMVQGGPSEIEHVLWLMQRNVPIIVISGVGKASDLLAFAYKVAKEIHYAQNYEVYVKKELLRRLGEEFPDRFRDNSEARNECRDKILQCVSIAQADPALLTIVAAHFPVNELRDLDKFILAAVLETRSDEQASKSDHRWQEQLHWKLQLTIDWKRPDLALSQIFKKYNLNYFVVSHDQFQDVLLRPGREGFVELFLDRGFLLHMFLTERRLEVLFERCPDKNFFVGVCLENVLGRTAASTTGFVSGRKCLMNQLLSHLTRINDLIHPELLTINAMKDKEERTKVAEQRALHALIYWAALTNNTTLCHLLWTRVNEPMAMALTLSTLHSGLTWHITDRDLKHKIKAIGIDFGKLALTMLDLLYNESQLQAMRAVTVALPDFHDYSALEIALLGKNKFFLAHPCCQRQISNMWYGSIRIRPFIAMHDMLKILLCVIFVLPTFIWVEVEKDRAREVPHKSISKMKLPSFMQQLFYLWTAPITKYLVTCLYFMAFLVFFSYSLLLPFCGDYNVNVMVFVWLLTILMDIVYVVMAKGVRYTWSPEHRLIRFIIIATITALLVLFSRVMHIFTFKVMGIELHFSFFRVKFFLSVSLIYFFYFFMSLCFTVSTILGPMLVNITIMTKRDMITWFRTWILTMVSGAVTIHAVLYPAQPITLNSVLMMFHRGLFALLHTDVADLAGDASCSCLYNDTKQYGCRSDLIDGAVRERMSDCPYSSPWGYFFVLNYLFSTKLVFFTLIFAICSATMTNTFEKAVEIWKYQFCLLVNNFRRRPPLPIPFAIFLYPFILVRAIYNILCGKCVERHPKHYEEEAHTMWRAIIKQYQKVKNQNIKDKENEKEIQMRLKALSKAQSLQGKSIEALNDRFVGVMNSQTNTFLILEQVKHMIIELNMKHSELARAEMMTRTKGHIFSRKSPYANTSTKRFAVFDRYVSWDETYTTYDPVFYNRPVQEFEENERPFVDEEAPTVYEPEEAQSETIILKTDDDLLIESRTTDKGGSPRTSPSPKQSLIAHRRSWISKDDKPMQYVIDQTNLPRNPMGRTGLRGRGNLWRYGPNHMIFVIITRWRSIYNSEGVKQSPLLVQGKRVLEVLVVQNPFRDKETLPGTFVDGSASCYSTIIQFFMKELLHEVDAVSSTQLDQEDMIQFFRQFVRCDFSLGAILSRGIPPASSFSYSLVHKGYMDDTFNTDNAWMEAEIWAFHYNTKESFNKKIPDYEKHWREINPYMELVECQLSHVLEVAKNIEGAL